MKFSLANTALLTAVFLAGCGGGGLSADSATSPAAPVATPPTSVGPTVALDAAISALYSTNQTYSRVETDPRTGSIYTVTGVFSDVSDTTIENIAVKSVDITRTILKDGTLYRSSSETSYFLTSPYRLIASRFNGSTTYIVASNQMALPTTARPGDAGKFYDLKVYDSPAKGNLLTNISQSWTVAADSATTVSFCVNSLVAVPQSPGITGVPVCVKIDTSGKVAMLGFNIPQ